MHFQNDWELKEYDIKTAQKLEEELGLSRIIARLLVQRGIKTIQDAQKFLYAGLSDLSDPLAMTGMKAAVSRIERAIASGEQIVVYGDYDVDGVCSTVLLVECLQTLGTKPAYYVPSRFGEGYGLNVQAIENLYRQGCRLLISVDCGIASVEEVNLASHLGMDIIITDHHTPGEQLPAAIAIINPKLDQNQDITNLAGVGVAFKLATALSKNKITEQQLYEWLDLVALATVADIVPLLGENRILLKYGLERLGNTRRPGLQALFKEAGLTGKSISPWHLGFVLGPRLNSAGRLDSARTSIELLLTGDPVMASDLAVTLGRLNSERRLIEEGIFQEALTQIESSIDLESRAAIVLAADNWHHGVIGIVASRLCAKYQRPVVLICWEGDTGRGSARSVPGVDIYEALSNCGSFLLQFGGHQMAAGLSIGREQFAGFTNEFLKWIRAATNDEELTPVHLIDSEIETDEINLDLLKEFAILEPFGEGNPTPCLAWRAVEINQFMLVGKQQEHFKMLAGPGLYEGIAFNKPQYINMPFDNCYHDLIFELGENEFRGRKSMQMKIQDLKCSFHPDRRIGTGFRNKVTASLGRAVMELQNNRPVVFVFPTCRSLKLLQASLTGYFRTASLRPLHGFMELAQKRLAIRDLGQGINKMFLLTRASLRHYLRNNELPANLQYIVEVGPGPDVLHSCMEKRIVERLYSKAEPLAWKQVEWNYDALKTTIIYANRRRTIQQLAQKLPGLITAAGIKDDRTRQKLRRRFRESENAVLLTDSSWREIAGYSLAIDELIFADVPFSIWEAGYVMEQLAAGSEHTANVLFNSHEMESYREYLARIYPNLEKIKVILNFFKNLGKNQIKVDLKDLLDRIGQWLNHEFAATDLWPILHIMQDLGLCSFEKKGSIIAIMFHSMDKKLVDISDSSYYLEGLAEKKEFSRLEVEINKYLAR